MNFLIHCALRSYREFFPNHAWKRTVLFFFFFKCVLDIQIGLEFLSFKMTPHCISPSVGLKVTVFFIFLWSRFRTKFGFSTRDLFYFSVYANVYTFSLKIGK